MNELDPSEEVIFNAARQFADAEKLRQYLDLACEGEPETRQRIERLLANAPEADSFFGRNAVIANNLFAPAAHLAPAEAGSGVEERPGSVIGRYKLMEKIGEGGCGVVYVAQQEEPVRRRVALKVIKLGMDTRQVVARFEAERQALAMMDHPNIAKVLDAGATETGRPYFVMELVRGVKITEFCDQNQLPTQERLKLFIEVCRAVQHAHQKGIIHRDLKPSNILVTVNDGVPVPKVIDFGIAKATQGELSDKTVYTQFQQLIGTPAYMSPEQAEMTSVDIDTRTDIYGLGVLLYELLTGRTPFEAKELVEAGLDEMRRTIREREPLRPSTRLNTLVDAELRTTAKARQTEPPKLLHLVRGDLDWIVMKCLEKDRARRYETANGLATDIQRHLNNEPVVARPPSAAYRYRKAFRRNRLAFTAAGGIAVALVAGVGIAAIGWRQARLERDNALKARAAEETEREHAQANEQKARLAEANQAKLRQQAQAQELAARRRAYASDMNLVQQALSVNNLGRALNLLNLHRPQPAETDLRGWEWRYLWQQCQSAASGELVHETNAIVSLAISPDGKWLAIGQEARGGLAVLDLQSRAPVINLPAGRGAVCSAFSPREPLLAFSCEPGTNSPSLVQVWNADTKQTLLRLPLGGRCVRLAFSKDGRKLIASSAGQDGKLTLWLIPEGIRLKDLPAPQLDSPRVAPFAVTPDLSVAAVADDTLRVIDLATGNELWTATAENETFTSLAFSPDGKTLVSAEGVVYPAIRFWDAATGKQIGVPLTDHLALVGELIFWPDGKTLASASADQTIRLWNVGDLTHVRRLGRPLRGHTQEVWRIGLLADNRTLVSGCKDGSVLVWNTSAPRDDRSVVTLPGKIQQWRFTPDDQSIVALDSKGRVLEWLGPEFVQTKLLFEIGPPPEAWFSQDGRLLAAGFTNGLVRIWDTRRAMMIHELRAGTNPVVAWQFLAHGQKLMISEISNPIDRLWDLSTERVVHSWSRPPDGRAWVFSPDERWWVLLSASGECWIRDVASGRETPRKLDISETCVDGATFSPDGKTFAAASESGYTRVWETATWQTIETLRGVLLNGRSVGFSSDGTRLATGGGGQEALILWDTVTYKDLLTLSAQGSRFGFFGQNGFSLDGNALASMNQQGVLHLWRAPSFEQIETWEKTRLP